MIEPREDEDCATCQGFYEPLTDRRGVRVRLDREDRYFCQVCARLIAAAWQAAQGGGRDEHANVSPLRGDGNHRDA